MFSSITTRRALKLAATYGAIAAVWILFSDAALHLVVPNSDGYVAWSTVKGWGFVAVTATVLFFGARAMLRRGWSEGNQARRLLACTGDGIYGLNLAGACTFANDALAEMLGYDSVDALIGQTMHDRIHHHHPDGAPYPAEECPIHGGLMKGRSFHSSREVVFRRDGTPVPVAVSSQPLTDDRGALVGAVIALRDVTPLERARAAVEESEQRFRRLFENTPVPYQSLDADGRIVAVNKAWLDALGYRRSDVIGQWFGDFLVEADRRLFPERFEAFKAQRVAAGAEYDVLTAGGHVRRVSFEGRVSLDLAGAVVQTHCVMTDLTERRAFLNALESSVTGMAKSDAELVRFSQVVAHDLQEPVREVVSFLDLVQRRLGGSLSADAQEYMHFAQLAGERMKQHLLALQSFVAVVAQRHAFVPVSLNGVCRDVLAFLDPALADDKDRVTVADLPTVAGDPGLLRILFRVLVDNALRYRRPAVAPEIRIDARRDDGAIVIQVIDNGRGIDASQRSRVFEAFTRLAAPGEPVTAGMGLTVARKICDIHKGSIWVEDRPDRTPGTVVSVRLPLDRI
ncbi:PAS domain S-box protein [Roseospira goensis]|uniref:histidine kinase n=1 Tax=Roseospira goensis TaxID=391922 RepID=A0A7W6S275_9PROT|nr:PAS domain S-box protein [Roseospira goensis]MBB4286827.1 PAS domain S-box-containing protein [Roseospira goensis]